MIISRRHFLFLCGFVSAKILTKKAFGQAPIISWAPDPGSTPDDNAMMKVQSLVQLSGQEIDRFSKKADYIKDFGYRTKANKFGQYKIYTRQIFDPFPNPASYITQLLSYDDLSIAGALNINVIEKGLKKKYYDVGLDGLVNLVKKNSSLLLNTDEQIGLYRKELHQMDFLSHVNKLINIYSNIIEKA